MRGGTQTRGVSYIGARVPSQRGLSCLMVWFWNLGSEEQPQIHQGICDGEKEEGRRKRGKAKRGKEKGEGRGPRTQEHKQKGKQRNRRGEEKKKGRRTTREQKRREKQRRGNKTKEEREEEEEHTKQKTTTNKGNQSTGQREGKRARRRERQAQGAKQTEEREARREGGEEDRQRNKYTAAPISTRGTRRSAPAPRRPARRFVHVYAQVLKWKKRFSERIRQEAM